MARGLWGAVGMKAHVFGVSLGAALVLAGCGGGGGAGLFPSPRPEPVESTISQIWTDTLLEALRAGNKGPTAGSRAIAMTTTAMYDAWAVLDPLARAVYTRDEDLRVEVAVTDATTRVAVSYAAYRVLVDLFPESRSRLEGRMRELGYDPDLVSVGTGSGVEIGNLAAENLLLARRFDGSNQYGDYADTSGYAPVNTVDKVVDPSRWQPMTFVLADGTTKTPGFLTPHWGDVTPFALSSGKEFRCSPPVPAGTAEFERQAREVMDYQVNLTDETKMVAEYWADGPNSELPPGHWLLLAKHAARLHGLGVEDEVKLFMLQGNAVLDAGIACWESKRYYDYVRPITAIRALFGGQKVRGWAGPGQGIQWIDGSQWQPYQPASFITPPFAELPSGHSTFSAASAEVLRSYLGSDRLDYSVTFLPGSSKHEPGFAPSRTVTLRFRTFSEAVESAGISRMWGGIHFTQGNVDGQEMGRLVGERVFSRATRLFQGERG